MSKQATCWFLCPEPSHSASTRQLIWLNAFNRFVALKNFDLFTETQRVTRTLHHVQLTQSPKITHSSIKFLIFNYRMRIFNPIFPSNLQFSITRNQIYVQFTLTVIMARWASICSSILLIKHLKVDIPRSC